VFRPDTTYVLLYQQCRVCQLLTEICNLPRHGPQGIHNEASKATLQHEFGTSDDSEAILKILDQGEMQENFVREIPLIMPLSSFHVLP
jgi:hypothetical protein